MMLNKVDSINELEKTISVNENVFFYGAGKLCAKILYFLEYKNNLRHIRGVYVSDMVGNPREIRGVPVKEYSEESCMPESVIIITIISAMEQKIICRTLSSDGMSALMIDVPVLEKELNRILSCVKYREIKDKLYRYLHNTDKYIETDHREDIRFYSFPYWDIYAPFSAVPSLVARVKRDGYEASQVDLGVLCAHNRINRQWKKIAHICSSQEFYDQNIREYRKNPYGSYQDFLSGMWFFKEDVFPLSQVKKTYSTMNSVQKCVVDAFYGRLCDTDMSIVSFDQMKNLSDVVEAYILSDFADAIISEEILLTLQNMPALVGVSVTSIEQFLPACVFSKLVKDILPNVTIIMGGSCADLFYNSQYRDKTDIFQFFDYVIIGEGETAISKLMEHFIDHKGSLKEIPNLIQVLDHGEITVSHRILEDVETLPCPDYDGLNLSLYMAPELLLPYQSSRGCHYGYCAFCNHDKVYRHYYRAKSAEKIVSDMILLSQKYSVTNFQFVDEAIRPDCFKEIVCEMDRHYEFRNIHWMFYSRVSRQYNSELLQKAVRNGCKMVMFGVESFNQRLLKFIRKGINAETSKYCLKLFHQSGIKTYAWLMCNLPSETIEEAKCDLEEVKQEIEYIDAFNVSLFYLSRNTDMFMNPRGFNILEIDCENPTRFISYNFGEIIDKEEMFHFYETEYKQYQLNHFSTGNRYTLYFED